MIYDEMGYLGTGNWSLGHCWASGFIFRGPSAGSPYTITQTPRAIHLAVISSTHSFNPSPLTRERSRDNDSCNFAHVLPKVSAISLSHDGPDLNKRFHVK